VIDEDANKYTNELVWHRVIRDRPERRKSTKRLDFNRAQRPTQWPRPAEMSAKRPSAQRIQKVRFPRFSDIQWRFA
jgi:hypothetical protein